MKKNIKRTELLGVKTSKAEKDLIKNLSEAQGYPSQSEFVRTIIGAYLCGLCIPGSVNLGKNLAHARDMH
jgi:hypothetical protein